MRFPYFPGCALKTTAMDYEVSAIAAAEALDIDLVELPRWNCCGTCHSLTSDDLMHHLAAVRDLIRVQELEKQEYEDERLVTLCPHCFTVLKRTDLFVKKDPDNLMKINLAMERDEEQPYEGKVEVVHFLELLREKGFDKINERVKKPLKNLKVVPFYGCLLLRPKEIGIDKPENPSVLEDLLRSLGAEVIDNPYKLKCCGNYLTVNDKYVVAELTYNKLKYASNVGAEAMVVTCPLCAFNLDSRQKEVAELHSDFEKIPIFYFTQLMSLAFGLKEETSIFEQNHVDPKPLLKNKKLL